MFMHPYISREPARERQRDMLTRARPPAPRSAAHAESGGEAQVVMVAARRDPRMPLRARGSLSAV